MSHILRIILVALGVFLPMHGAMTVFLPDMFRFWKETLLLLLCLLVVVQEVRRIAGGRHLFFHPAQWAGVGFLVWCGCGVLLSQDVPTAAMAARYLCTGVVAFLCISRLLQYERLEQPGSKTPLWWVFGISLIIGTGISALFGIWAHFLGGYEVLSGLYSSTISSWVPGQTLPLYHEADGTPRMQGMASGPVAFAHLLLLGVFWCGVLPVHWWGKGEKNLHAEPLNHLLKHSTHMEANRFRTLSWWWKAAYMTLATLCIWESASRAALLALVVGGGVWVLMHFGKSLTKHIYVWLGVLVCIPLLLGGVFFPRIQEEILSRAGSSDHFTRPVQAVQDGFASPVFGSLGSYGPAARAKNMELAGTDHAPIAENVWADIFVQTGVMGLLLFALLFFFRMRSSTQVFVPFWVGFLLTTNMATLFDMVPLAILVFVSIAFSGSLRTIAGHG